MQLRCMGRTARVSAAYRSYFVRQPLARPPSVDHLLSGPDHSERCTTARMILKTGIVAEEAAASGSYMMAEGAAR